MWPPSYVQFLNLPTREKDIGFITDLSCNFKGTLPFPTIKKIHVIV